MCCLHTFYVEITFTYRLVHGLIVPIKGLDTSTPSMRQQNHKKRMETRNTW